MKYYVLLGNETKGPYTLGQMRSMWLSGSFTSETQYCEEGGTEWRDLREIQRDLEAEGLPTHESKSKKSSRRNKAIGAALMFVGIPGCVAASQTTDGVGLWLGMLGMAAFAIGFALFIIGRLRE